MDKKPRWGQRPADADTVALGIQRSEVLKDLNVRSPAEYEKESHYTPRWVCPCGRENACSMSSCEQCSDDRPPILHGDPDQGDQVLGLARMVARGTLQSMDQIPNDYYTLARTWKSKNGNTLDHYKFDTEQKIRNRYLGWQGYLSFLLGGGTV